MEEITAEDILLSLIEPIDWIGRNVLGLRGNTLRDWVFEESTGSAAVIAAALNLGSCSCWRCWREFSIGDPVVALQNCLHQHALANWDGVSARGDFLTRAVLGQPRAVGRPSRYMNDFRRGMLAKVVHHQQLQVGYRLGCSVDGCFNYVERDDQCSGGHRTANPHLSGGQFRCHRTGCPGVTEPVSRCTGCKSLHWDDEPACDPPIGRAGCPNATCGRILRRERRCRSCKELAWSHEPNFWMWERDDATWFEVTARRCMACHCLFFDDAPVCPAPNCRARNRSRKTRVWVVGGHRAGACTLQGVADERQSPAEEAARREDSEEVIRQLETWPADDPLRLVAWEILVEDRTDYDAISEEHGFIPESIEFYDAVREIMGRLGLAEG